MDLKTRRTFGLIGSKNKFIGKNVFYFKNFDSEAKDILENNYVYFKKHSQLNDKFEFTKNSQIACFSNGLNNPYLWQRYANNLEGICIKYNVTDTDNFFHEVKYDNNSFRRCCT